MCSSLVYNPSKGVLLSVVLVLSSASFFLSSSSATLRKKCLEQNPLLLKSTKVVSKRASRLRITLFNTIIIIIIRPSSHFIKWAHNNNYNK